MSFVVLGIMVWFTPDWVNAFVQFAGQLKVYIMDGATATLELRPAVGAVRALGRRHGDRTDVVRALHARHRADAHRAAGSAADLPQRLRRRQIVSDTEHITGAPDAPL